MACSFSISTDTVHSIAFRVFPPKHEVRDGGYDDDTTETNTAAHEACVKDGAGRGAEDLGSDDVSYAVANEGCGTNGCFLCFDC